MARRVSLVDLSSKRRRLRRILFWGAMFLAAGLAVVGILWAVIYSGVFDVREINISGATYVSQDDILAFLKLHVAQGRLSRFLGPGNIFAWPSGFSEDGLRDLPAVSALDIRRRYIGREIDVTVTERKRAGIWCFAETGPRRCFWFDDKGTVFMSSYSAEGNLTFLLEDRSRSPLPLGEKVLSPRFLPNLFSIFSALQSTHLSIVEVRLEDLDREEIEAYAHGGPKLLFSLRFPAAGVQDAIAAIEKAVDLSKLEYIDFRVENKVYYK